MELEHFAEEAALCFEFCGGAGFDDLTVLQDHDLVGICDGAHAVGDDDDGLVLYEFRNALLNFGFVFDVEACGSFVEEYDGGVLEDGAGDGDSLAFAAGERVAVFTNDGVVALRELLDEVITVCKLCGSQDFFVGGVALTDANVVADGRVEQHNILEDDGEVLEERFGIDSRDVLAAERDGAALNVPEAGGELCCCCLSATGRADECGDFALLCGERSLFQDLLFFVVVEVDVLEFDVVIGGFEPCGTALDFHIVHFLESLEADIQEEKFRHVI